MSDLVTIQQTINQHIVALPPQSTVIVVVDGEFSAPLSQLQFLSQNITLADFTQGLTLQVAENIVVEQPLCLLAIFTAASEHKTYQWQHEINVQAAAKITVFECYCSVGEAAFTCEVTTKLHLASHAELAFHKLQELSEVATITSKLMAEQEQYSKLKTCHVVLGSKYASESLHIKLQQEYAMCDLSGFYAAKDTQQQIFNIKVEHLVPHCTSTELYKGIIDDHATANFAGRIIIVKDAIKSEANLTNRNLLLNENAQVAVAPEMEVYADDVKCSHGATVGQLDEQILYYLQTRGIDFAMAKQMLLMAFREEVLQKFIIKLWQPL